MSGWVVALRGIGHRLGRSLLILAVATVGTASGVATAAYERSAQQSILIDGLRSAAVDQTSIVLGGPNQQAVRADRLPSLDKVQAALAAQLAGLPLLRAATGPAIVADDTDTLVGPDGGGYARLGFRSGVCSHLAVTGRCPTAAGQVMISDRTASALGVTIGDKLAMQLGIVEVGSIARPATVQAPPGQAPPLPGQDRLAPTVVGIYGTPDPTAAYWNGDAYFSYGTGQYSPNGMRYDAVFAGSDDDVRSDPAGPVLLHVEVPLRLGVLGIDAIPEMRSELGRLEAGIQARAGLSVTTGLLALLDDVVAQQGALATTIPVAAVPLILLALFVLFLVIAAIVEERAPELALAKLRGFSPGAASRFGSVEMLLLVALSAPAGLVAGAGAAAAAAKLLLARGTGVELRWPLPAAAGAVALLGCVIAWLATRVRLRQSVLSLSRRVPAAGTRGGSVAAVIAIVVIAGSLVAALMDRSSPAAWLAAPSIAVVAGLAGARLLSATASRRLRGAARHGRLVGLISGAWVARQPGRARVTAVLTTAVALLAFGAIGWDAAAQARHDAGVERLGTDRVYRVAVPDPETLVAAVRSADPSGNAMAAAWTSTYFAGAQVSVYAVESQKLAEVGLWPSQSGSAIASIAASLRPRLAPPVYTTGKIAVTAQVTTVPGGTFILEALVQRPGQPTLPVVLGTLHAGAATYAGTGAGCAGGCRLVGFALQRLATGASGTVELSMQVSAVTGDGIDIDDFSDAAYWAAVAPRTDGVGFAVTAGRSLGVRLSTGKVEDETIAYRDTPDVLPVVVSGGAKADDPAAAQFSFPGLDGNPTPMTVVARVSRIPAGGADAILADFGVATRMAERSGALADNVYLAYQVWADANAPADLGRRLALHGVTVLSSQSVEGYVEQLSRSAPTLSFWFYLITGVVALLLGVGVMLAGTYVGSGMRAYAYAALRLAGVPRRALRASVRREYLSVLGIALVLGAAAGGLGALLMLPGIPLVTAHGATGDVPYGGHMVALYAALAVTVAAMYVMVVLAVRVVRRATPERLREGMQ